MNEMMMYNAIRKKEKVLNSWLDVAGVCVDEEPRVVTMQRESERIIQRIAFQIQLLCLSIRPVHLNVGQSNFK